MDTDFMIQALPLFMHAAAVTLAIGLAGIVLSCIIGMAVCIISFFKVPLLCPLSKAYVELSRNTPLLVQLFFIYFGLPKLGIFLSGEASAAAGLAFLGGSYMAESFRSGLESVPKDQMESALALGLTRFQSLRYIIFPQGLFISFPSILANVLFLIKETSVFSVCAIPDLMYVAKDLIGLYYKTDETLWLLVISYLLLLLPLSLGAGFLERRLSYAHQ